MVSGITITSPEDALRRAVDIVGSQAAMGRLLGVSQPTVWEWLNKGKSLPAEHVLAVEAATGVPKEQLRPDIYPPFEGEADNVPNATRADNARHVGTDHLP